MAANAIEVQQLGKRYRLGEHSGSYVTLREVLSSALPWRRDPHQQTLREIWALRDVDLVVPEGEVLGVIGPNGAGKSTLLRILARITEPTTGHARTRGQVGALLEVGTGFHPELTGRENVFLNGALLGMSRRDMGRRFDDIVEFAGLTRFLDTPLKRYSTGMHLRLAFAVAAQVEPRIIVADEVLAVGDAEFQERCLGKMAELGREGRTVVFVSHDLGSIARLCERAIWLDGGRIRLDGLPVDVVNSYLQSTLDRAASVDLPRQGGGRVHLLGAALTDQAGSALRAPKRGDQFSLRLKVALDEAVPGLDVAIYLLDHRGIRVLDDAWSDRPQHPPAITAAGEYELTVAIPPLLAAGDYVIGVWIGTSYERFVEREVLTFRVQPQPDDRAHLLRPTRVVHVDLDWTVAPAPREDSLDG